MNERCWTLVGFRLTTNTIVGMMCRKTEGTESNVRPDAKWTINRHLEYNDIIGFLHTHPGESHTPSSGDLDVMEEWQRCLGKPLFHLIANVDISHVNGYRYWNYTARKVTVKRWWLFVCINYPKESEKQQDAQTN